MFRCLVCDRECADFEFPVNSYHMCYHCHVDMAIVHSTFALTHADLLPYGALVVEVALSPIHVGAIDQGHAVDFAQIAGGATEIRFISDLNSIGILWICDILLSYGSPIRIQIKFKSNPLDLSSGPFLIESRSESHSKSIGILWIWDLLY